MDVHAVGYLWLNARGRYLRHRLLAQALHMVARRPTVLILAEARSGKGPEDPPFLNYTRHIVLPANGKTGAVSMCMSARGPPPGQSCSAVMRTPTPSYWRCSPCGESITCRRPMPPKSTVAVSPTSGGGRRYGARLPGMVDAALVLVVADTNSAARPADRGTPRPDDTGYQAFLRAFTLKDLVDVPRPDRDLLLFQGDRPLPHRHGRLPQGRDGSRCVLPLLGQHPPV